MIEEMVYEIPDHKEANGWVTFDNEEFQVSVKTFDKLESNLYRVSLEQGKGIVIKKVKVSNSKQIKLPSLPTDQIVKDFDVFWESKPTYAKYEKPHKRGTLLHGESGCGKTTLVKLLVEEMKLKDGLCFEILDPVAWYLFIPIIKKIEPNRPILAIIEDFDSIIADEEDLILNLLDGLTTEDGVFYLMTTNNLADIPERIKDRPSRVDKKYEIVKPTKEDREYYFKNIIHEDDIDLYPIETLVKDTEGYSLAELNEVITNLYILRNEYAVGGKKGKKLARF